MDNMAKSCFFNVTFVPYKPIQMTFLLHFHLFLEISIEEEIMKGQRFALFFHCVQVFITESGERSFILNFVFSLDYTAHLEK